jgi:hypothetical protein
MFLVGRVHTEKEFSVALSCEMLSAIAISATLFRRSLSCLMLITWWIVCMTVLWNPIHSSLLLELEIGIGICAIELEL